jgi:hypothetical protein
MLPLPASAAAAKETGGAFLVRGGQDKRDASTVVPEVGGAKATMCVRRWWRGGEGRGHKGFYAAVQLLLHWVFIRTILCSSDGGMNVPPHAAPPALLLVP